MEQERVGGKDEELDRVVTPANFQRTFQCIPEAVALGLFDGAVGPQALVQIFLRFLFQQLNTETDLESRHAGLRVNSPQRSFSPIDDIFGFGVVSATRFLQSGQVEVGEPIRAFVLDLV